MRSAVILLLVAAVLSGATSASADCPPKRKSKIVAETENKRAVVVRTAHHGGIDDAEIATLWACLRPAGRWRVITKTVSDDFTVDSVRLVTLAGTKVAYAWEQGDPRQDLEMGVRVHDLRRRRLVSDLDVGLWPQIRRVVLAASGAIAFSVSEYDFEDEPPVPRLHRRIYTARGNRMTLRDDGLEIRLTTLKRRGSRVTWRHGEETRQTPLR